MSGNFYDECLDFKKINDLDFLRRTDFADFSISNGYFKHIPSDLDLLKFIGRGSLGAVFLGTSSKNSPFGYEYLKDSFFCVKVYEETDKKEIWHFDNLPFNKKNKDGNFFLDIRNIDNIGMMPVYDVGKNFVISGYCGDVCLESFVSDVASCESKRLRKGTFLNYFWDLLFTAYKNSLDGISHNDINPENILFHKNRLIWIDFDLVSRFGANIFNDKRNCLGSVGFSAPEQCTSGNVSEKNDVYSLGAVLYKFTQGDHHVVKSLVLNDFKDDSNDRYFSLDDWRNHINFFSESFPVESVGFGNNVLFESLVCGMLKKNPDERLGIVDCIRMFYDCFNDYLGFSSVNEKLDEFNINRKSFVF